MAKYNREFLVPYLRDVCALHLARRKLNNHRTQLESAIRDAERMRMPVRPTAPVHQSCIDIGALVFGGIAVFIIILFYSTAKASSFWSDFGMFCVAIWGIFHLYCGFHSFSEDREAKEQEDRTYRNQMSAYKNDMEIYLKTREQFPTMKTELQTCSKEISRITTVAQNVYGANIIPGQYRNIYAAVYLYDYFSNSREDDLALALNTFVLEQIKAKLDVIIANQSEMILNQAMMLANQQRSLELQNQHTAQMQAMAHRIASSAEEQSAYLSMIESNTATTAYFATADFIRRL